MTYVSEPLSRLQLRNIAFQIRKIVALENELYFPIVEFLELGMQMLFPNFTYEIVPISAFPEEKHADTDPINHCIRIRLDVYEGALSGNGRDRMTIAHEIAHYILMAVYKIRFSRSFSNEAVPVYCDPEWQAKALAGELMCAVHLIKDYTSFDEVALACGVSSQAAKYNLLKLKAVM